MSRRSVMTGFTLIELLIVIVVVGILAFVALPGYQDAMEKGRRADAHKALMDAANRQEQFMLDRSSYTADMTALGFSADPMVSDDGYYSVDRVAATNCALTATTCYVLRATPVAGSVQSRDGNCTSLTLDSRGARSATGANASECW
ncbi:MAG: type IV pilin protein [Pseudomonadota bacterium]